MLTLVLVVILAALVFEFINGFHDTANSIATVVATKVLSPGSAVMLAAGMNLIGALTGTAVAMTIANGILNSDVVAVTPQVILCALLGGIVWNLITWWFGLPSSSSHALIGGLIGAALAGAGLALGRSPLLDAELASGRLLRLFAPLSLPGSWAFVLRAGPDAARDPHVVQFCDFLLQEAGSLP